jgi:hypothetical protein
LHVAQRFELFLDEYHRPDGSRWTGQEIDEATGAVRHPRVTRGFSAAEPTGECEPPNISQTAFQEVPGQSRDSCACEGALMVSAQPVKASICASISGKDASSSSTLPCSTSGGSTPGHSVLASSA